MEFKVYTRAANGQLVLSNLLQCANLVWEERYNAVGKMQAVFPKSPELLSIIKTGIFALIPNTNRMMYIHSIKTTDSEIWAYGYEAKALFQKQALLSDFAGINGTRDLSGAIQYAVDEYCGFSFVDTEWFNIPSNFGSKNLDALEYENLYEFLTQICALQSAGWHLEYEETTGATAERKLYVYVDKGTDKHTTQIFSSFLGNAWGIVYARNDQPFVTDVYVYGMDAITDPENPELVTAHAARTSYTESFRVALNLTESFPRTDEMTRAEYEAALQTKADMSLIARHSEESVTVQNIDTSKFGTDFALGDIVAVRIPEYGLEAQMRITGATRTVDRGREKVSLSLSTVAITG